MVDFKYYDGGQDIYVRIRNANGIVIDRIYDVPESQWNDCRLTTLSFAGFFLLLQKTLVVFYARTYMNSHLISDYCQVC